MSAQLTMIAAISEDLVLAVDDALPWRLPQDLRRFKAVTSGHPVVMGRRTLDTLPGLLSDRVNIVLSSRPDRLRDGVLGVSSFDEAIATGRAEADRLGVSTVFIAGGAKVYELGLAVCDRLDLTRVRGTIGPSNGAVTRFPRFDERSWRLDSLKAVDQPPRHSHGFAFELWSRRSGSDRVKSAI